MRFYLLFHPWGSLFDAFFTGVEIPGNGFDALVWAQSVRRSIFPVLVVVAEHLGSSSVTF